MQRKKRPFVLLEVLIGLFLLTLFAPFLLKIPISTYQKDSKAMQILEYDRIFALSLAEVRERFFCKQIPWNAEGNSYFLPPLPSFVPLRDTFLVERQFIIESTSEITTKNGTYQKLRVKVILSHPSLSKASTYTILRKATLLKTE